MYTPSPKSSVRKGSSCKVSKFRVMQTKLSSPVIKIRCSSSGDHAAPLIPLSIVPMTSLCSLSDCYEGCTRKSKPTGAEPSIVRAR